MQSLPHFLAAGVVLLGCASGLIAAENDADNTARNAQDQDRQALTATDQANDSASLQLVAAIRKAVVADENLSGLAKNAKIITGPNGQATLRGPVKSDAEKTRLEEIAREAGAKKITNDLEVEKAD